MNLFAGFGAGWLWLALVLVSGWVMLQSRFFRHFLWDASAHDRYFLIILAGIAALLIGIGIAIGFGIAVPALRVESFEWKGVWNFSFNDNVQMTPEHVFIASAFSWSAPIALFVSMLIFAVSFCCIGEETIYNRRVDFLAGKNGFLKFVEDASKNQSIAMFTLSNRKVYIGWPEDLSDWNNPDPSKQYLSFLPFMSGVRKQDSMELEITTDYVKPYRDLLRENSEIDVSELQILLPVHEIIHAQPFDENLYKEGVFNAADEGGATNNGNT